MRKTLSYVLLCLGLITSLDVPACGRGALMMPSPKPQVDVVFVLDTTGSMSGLIAAAKEKIWAIANTLTKTEPAPQIRMGLIGYRDKGDDYVTRVTDLTDNLDAVYESLTAFSADGGGDEAESVNQALHEAITRMSWRKEANTYKAIFLVGDAPPHMDYQDDVKYPQSLKLANQHGIVVNAIQCGESPDTTPIWREIAQRTDGSFFTVSPNGNAVAVATPFDADLARLSTELETTRVPYGSAADQERQAKKFSLSGKVHAAAPASAKASRAELNAKASGSRNLLGDKELVQDIKEGKVRLDALKNDELPMALRSLPKEEQAKRVTELSTKRQEIQQKIHELSEKRQSFIAGEMKKTKDASGTLDHKVYTAIREQAAKKQIIYKDGPAY